MIKFESTGVYQAPGRGRVYVVELDHEVKDFDWLIGKEALIDGHYLQVKGVELFTHHAPWRKGEPIGIRVEEKK